MRAGLQSHIGQSNKYRWKIDSVHQLSFDFVFVFLHFVNFTGKMLKWTRFGDTIEKISVSHQNFYKKFLQRKGVCILWRKNPFI